MHTEIRKDIKRYLSNNNNGFIAELEAGRVSNLALNLFSTADNEQSEIASKWLELKLVILERRIRRGLPVSVENYGKSISLNCREDFYDWCEQTLPHAYKLFLKSRRY